MKCTVACCMLLAFTGPGLLAQNFRNPFPSSTTNAPTVSAPAIIIQPAPATPVQLDATDEAPAAKKSMSEAELLQWKRGKIHAFLINGIDPLYWGNLNGLGESLRGAGFHNSRWDQFFSQDFARQIAGLKASDPSNRIVLIGFSAGCFTCRSIAHQLAEQGVTVDCMCYIGGDAIKNTNYSRPGNVSTLINITGNGFLLTGGNLFFNGENIDGAVNLRIPVRHFSLPSHPSTYDLISQHMTQIANDIPAPK